MALQFVAHSYELVVRYCEQLWNPQVLCLCSGASDTQWPPSTLGNTIEQFCQGAQGVRQSDSLLC